MKPQNQIVNTNGEVGFSYAKIDFISKRKNINNIAYALQEIEHLLIWSVNSYNLQNEKKTSTLPGLGINGGHAWHIFNKGFRFSGRMPLEIVFPWLLVRVGRDVTAK